MHAHQSVSDLVVAYTAEPDFCPEQLCNEDDKATGIVTFHGEFCDDRGDGCNCTETVRCPCGCKTELERMGVQS